MMVVACAITCIIIVDQFDYSVLEYAPKPVPKKIRHEYVKKPLVVAIIDTGFGYLGKGNDNNLCAFGHKDFSIDGEYSDDFGTSDPVPLDINGHGTNVAGLIQKYAGNADYCIVIVKFWSNKNNSPNGTATIDAIKYATRIRADIINYSGGGIVKSQDEIAVVKKFLNNGGMIVTAAGNEMADMDIEKNHYYPAMDDSRIIVVGNAVPTTEEDIEDSKDLNKDKKTVYVDNKDLAFPAKTSNYGYRVNRWEYGNSAESYGIKLSGTSQAAAIATGKIINNLK